MTEGREPAALAPLPPAAESDDGADRRRIEVRPQDVFQRERLQPPRWTHRSFFAPILAVIVWSAALLYGLLLVLGGLWRLLD